MTCSTPCPFSKTQNITEQMASMKPRMIKDSLGTGKNYLERPLVPSAGWGAVPTHLVVLVEEGAAALFVGHTVKAAEDVSGQALAAFDAGQVALRGSCQVAAGNGAGRRAYAVRAVGGTLRSCGRKSGEVHCTGRLQHVGAQRTGFLGPYFLFRFTRDPHEESQHITRAQSVAARMGRVKLLYGCCVPLRV